MRDRTGGADIRPSHHPADPDAPNFDRRPARATTVLAQMPGRPQVWVRPAAAPRVSRRTYGRWLTALLLVGAALVVAGCGSSKPAYCSDRANLEKSVKQLPGLASSANLSGLKTEASKIQTQATTLVDSAKHDFPTESGALERDIDTLISSIKNLPSNPATQDYATIALSAATAVSAINNFNGATNAKCS